MEWNYSFKNRICSEIIRQNYLRKEKNTEFIKKLKYNDLLFLANKRMNRKEYEKLMTYVIKKQKLILREKIEKKEQIKVAFLCDSSSTWSFDKVYSFLEKDDRFFPYVVVPLLKDTEKENSGKDNSQFKEEYKRDVIKFLKEKKVRFYVVKEKEDARWGKLLPDILFTQKSYEKLYIQKNFNLHNMPMSCMLFFVPYSFWIDKLSDLCFSTNYMKIFAKVFYPSRQHGAYLNEVLEISDKRLFFSGYPKVDCYYEKKDVDSEKIWKNGKNKVHIIYAPGLVEGSKFSTFEMNYKMMLDIARKTKDIASWIIRVHPLMAEGCIRHGVFSDINEWNDYLEQWKSLSNADVSLNGSYEDIFRTSDGMIMDSVSFLPCYQYIKKPLLFLCRKTQQMNRLGNMLKEVVYKANGKDQSAIESFIYEVLINGKDNQKKLREEFFDENLDYFKKNGTLASDYIIQEILETIEESDKNSE